MTWISFGVIIVMTSALYLVYAQYANPNQQILFGVWVPQDAMREQNALDAQRDYRKSIRSYALVMLLFGAGVLACIGYLSLQLLILGAYTVLFLRLVGNNPALLRAQTQMEGLRSHLNWPDAPVAQPEKTQDAHARKAKPPSRLLWVIPGLLSLGLLIYTIQYHSPTGQIIALIHLAVVLICFIMDERMRRNLIDDSYPNADKKLAQSQRIPILRRRSCLMLVGTIYSSILVLMIVEIIDQRVDMAIGCYTMIIFTGLLAMNSGNMVMRRVTRDHNAASAPDISMQDGGGTSAHFSRHVMNGMTIFIAVLILGAGVYFAYEDFTQPVLTVRNDMLILENTTFPFEIPLSSIEAINLKNKLPMSLRGGFGYSSETFTRGSLIAPDGLTVYYSLYSNKPPYLCIQYEGGMAFYNGKKGTTAYETYIKLLNLLPRNAT